MIGQTTVVVNKYSKTVQLAKFKPTILSKILDKQVSYLNPNDDLKMINN